MFIFGLGVFFGIWFLLDDVLMLTKYSQQLLVGKYVFLYLALAKIFDMVTSINSYILIYSQYYRYNLAFVGVLGVLNVFLNLTLIPRFGIEGAAMATCLAMVLFNLAKLIFIYFKLGLSPFSVETLKVLALGCVSFGVLYLLPKGAYLPNTYLNLGLKGLIVGLLLLVTFAWPIYWLEVSKDINGLVHSLFSKVRRKK